MAFFSKKSKSKDPAPAVISSPPTLAASTGSNSSNQLQSTPPQQPVRRANAPQSTPTPVYPWSQRPVRMQPVNRLAKQSPPQDSPCPFPRYGHSVNALSSTGTGDFYLFGGLVNDIVRNDLYVASTAIPNQPITISLLETKGDAPGPRVGHASVGVGNVLIVWGGDTKASDDEIQDTGLYLLNVTTKEWTLVKVIGETPVGRYGHSAAVVGGKFYVFGGQRDLLPDQPDDGGFLNDMWMFDLQKLKAGQPRWTKVDHTPGTPVPPCRTGHSTVTYQDQIYIFGGTDGQYHYNDTWCFDIASRTWSKLDCIGYIPHPREGHAATLVDDVMYTFGGRGVDGKDLDDLGAFKISNQRWYMFQNMGEPPLGRSGHAMVSIGSKVFVVGGESYSTARQDNPLIMSILDSTKIKYPMDQRRAPQTQQQPSASTKLPQIQEEALRRQAGSPNGSMRQQSNIGQVMSSPQNTKAALPNTSRQPPPIQAPLRPRRDDDALYQARATSPHSQDPTRAISPTQLASSQPLPQTNQLQYSRNTSQLSQSYNNTSVSPTNQSPTDTSSPQIGSLRSINGNRSPSPTKMSASHPPPHDAFFYGQHGRTGTMSPQSLAKLAPSADIQNMAEELQELRQRDKWLQSALRSAHGKGFVLPPDLDSEKPEGVSGISSPMPEASAQSKLFDALLILKQELAQAKVALLDQAKRADEQNAAASKSRLLAIQEASYYRAKLTAHEQGSTAAISKIDSSRVAELERKLADVLSLRSADDRRVQDLETELEQERELRQSAEDRASAATQRAEAAETSHSRSLADYAELQRRVHATESSLRKHSERSVSLVSALQAKTAEHEIAFARLETADAANAQHVQTLEELQASIGAAHAAADEAQTKYAESRREVEDLRANHDEMQAQLDVAIKDADAQRVRADELEEHLMHTKDQVETMRNLNDGSMADLLNTYRSVTDQITHHTGLHQTSLRALEEERDSFKLLHDESKSREDNAHQELAEIRAKHVAAEKQLSTLRNEAASLRSRHASALDVSGRTKSQLLAKENEIREKSKLLEEAQMRNDLLRQILGENGLHAENLEHRGSPSGRRGSESSNADKEFLQRKIQDLESHIEELETERDEARTQHDEALQEMHSVEEQMREVCRQRDASENKADMLALEMDKLRSESALGKASSPSAADGERDYDALLGQHSQLQASHGKAVQYVKGTEKMLRRMKDELTRYKEENLSLKGQLADAKGLDSNSLSDIARAKSPSQLSIRSRSNSSTDLSAHNTSL